MAKQFSRLAKHDIGRDEPTPVGVVVATLQVVQTCLRVVLIPPVPEGVGHTQAARQAAAGAQQLAPHVILVFYHQRSAGVNQPDHVPLQVVQVPVPHAVRAHVAHPAHAVVEKVHRHRPVDVRQLIPMPDILRGNAPHDLLAPHPIMVIAVHSGDSAGYHLSQLPPAGPRVTPRPVSGYIAQGVVAHRCPVVVGQLVLPAAVPIGVRDRLLYAPQRARGVRVPLSRRDVSAAIVLGNLFFPD